MPTSHTESSHDTDTAIADICARHGHEPAALLEILHDIQDGLGCIPQAAMPTIAKVLNLSRAEVHGVFSFYHDFRDTPAARVIVKMCRAEACQARGALDLINQAHAHFGNQTNDVMIEPVYCLGNCALSPAALVNGKPIGRLDFARLQTAIRENGQ